ncbi:hypothetical protein PT276_10545 [Orbaceae bacterium ESL0721]|nr:hypothetical protein [Orbaceae bacterium ESL0721]
MPHYGRKLVDITMSQNIATYKRLNVTLSLLTPWVKASITVCYRSLLPI